MHPSRGNFLVGPLAEKAHGGAPKRLHGIDEEHDTTDTKNPVRRVLAGGEKEGDRRRECGSDIS